MASTLIFTPLAFIAGLFVPTVIFPFLSLLRGQYSINLMHRIRTQHNQISLQLGLLIGDFLYLITVVGLGLGSFPQRHHGFVHGVHLFFTRGFLLVEYLLDLVMLLRSQIELRKPVMHIMLGHARAMMPARLMRSSLAAY